MPKEKLNWAATREVTTGGTDEEFASAIMVEAAFDLKWTGGESGYAQYSVTMDRAQLEEVLASDLFSKDSQITMYSGTLSRYEMNNSIKVLRKARDQVHGADE